MNLLIYPTTYSLSHSFTSSLRCLFSCDTKLPLLPLITNINMVNIPYYTLLSKYYKRKDFTLKNVVKMPYFVFLCRAPVSILFQFHPNRCPRIPSSLSTPNHRAGLIKHSHAERKIKRNGWGLLDFGLSLCLFC